jgi:hypothetical protein
VRHASRNETETVELSQAASYLLDECRMVQRELDRLPHSAG